MEKKSISAIEQFTIDKVRQRRKELGISQKDLANKMDISIGFIGKVESNNHTSKWNLNNLNEIAKVLKCAPRDFLPDKPIPHNK